MTEKPQKQEAQILAAIESGARTVHDIHDATGIKNQRLHELLWSLRRDGLIRKTGFAPTRARTSVREVTTWEVAA